MSFRPPHSTIVHHVQPPAARRRRYLFRALSLRLLDDVLDVGEGLRLLDLGADLRALLLIQETSRLTRADSIKASGLSRSVRSESRYNKAGPQYPNLRAARSATSSFVRPY